MKNITNVFIESAPSRFKLPFGINKNVRLKAVSNEVRRDKKGVKINKGCYMTFVAIDVDNDNAAKAETTFSYFILDKPKYAISNFMHQFNQLVEIMQAVIPASKLAAAAKPLQAALVDNQDVFATIKSDTSTVPKEKFVKELVSVMDAVTAGFEEAVTPYLGEKGDLVNLVVVTGTNGQFFELPREDKGFIAKTEGGRPLSIDAKYVRWFEEKDTKKKADKDDLGDEEVIEEEELVIDDDQDFEDI